MNTPSADNRRALLGAAVIAAAVVLLAARGWQVMQFQPRYSDTGVYFGYVVQTIDGGRTAFRDVKIEYPPAAYWAMALPRMVSGHKITPATAEDERYVNRSYAVYATAYRAFMVLLELLALFFMLDIIRRRSPAALAWAAWTYVICSTLLVHVVLDRLDMGLWFLIAAWAWLWCQSLESSENGTQGKFAYLALGLSVSYKLVTVLTLPFLLLADWREQQHSFGKAVVLAFWCFCGAAIPFLVHFRAGLAPLEFLKFHGARGVQIESVAGSLLMLLAPLGLEISAVSASGSIDLASSISSWLASGSTLLLLAALGGLAVWALRQGQKYDRAAAYRMALLVLLVTLVFSKVLSAQFFVFAIPIAVLLACEVASRTTRLGISAVCIVIAALTTSVFPYLWFSIEPGASETTNPYGLVPALHVLPCTLLVIRNILFTAMVLYFGWKVLIVDASQKSPPTN